MSERQTDRQPDRQTETDRERKMKNGKKRSKEWLNEGVLHRGGIGRCCRDVVQSSFRAGV